MINNNTNDKGSETQSTNSSDSLSVEETKELLKGMGCWCPGYESHPTKRGICRNCGHSEADHDKKDGFCNYDGSYSTDYGNSSSDSKQQEEKRQREEEKSRVRRGHINTEILETERSYVAVLRKIKVYREELESCLDEKTIWDLFSNSDSLLELHENLLSKLEQCVQMHKIIASSLLSPAENGSGTSNASMARGTMAVDDEPCFGPIFVAIAPMFRLYKMYAAAHDNAVKVIHTIVGKEEVLKVCRGIMGDPDAPPHSAVLDLNSLLIAPIQRIPRYLLLMQDLIKHTPPGSENYVALTKAHEIVQEVAGEVNTCK